MRIVSLSPAATEILFALGRGKDIVAVDQFSNFPDAAKDVLHFRDHQKIAVKDVQELKADLILTETVIQERLYKELKAAHLPVVHLDPRTLDAVMESVTTIGILVEAEDAAKELMKRMKADMDHMKTKTKHLPRRPRVYIEEWPALQSSSGKHLPPMASGNWVSEVVQIAGGKAFPIPAGELSREVSLQEVMNFDPDLIVISWCGAGKLADKRLLMEREGWGQVRAVKEGRVRVIDDSLLNRPAPRLIEGMQQLYGWMFELLH